MEYQENAERLHKTQKNPVSFNDEILSYDFHYAGRRAETISAFEGAVYKIGCADKGDEAMTANVFWPPSPLF